VRVVVAIPAYNCEKQIPRVLEGFDDELCKRLEKIIVIDNRSSDSTACVATETIKKLGFENMEVIQNNSNYGLGGSHKAAFLYAEKVNADYLAILHGDNQAKTEELSILLDKAEENPELAAILGGRFMFKSNLDGYSLTRKFGNLGLNLIYTIITLRITKDLGSGLNLFRLKDLKDHRYIRFTDNFTFNIDLLLDYYKKCAKIHFTPITWSETDQVSNAKTFGVGWTALKTVLRWRFSKPIMFDKDKLGYSYKKIS